MAGKRYFSKLKRQATYSLQRECRSGLPVPKVFTVLGIETSCGKKDENDSSRPHLLKDDTAVAIVNSNGDILSNYIHSQVKLLPPSDHLPIASYPREVRRDRALSGDGISPEDH